VTDPGDYRWCGYAEAMAENRLALDGLMTITGIGHGHSHGQHGVAASHDQVSGETPRQQRRRELRALAEYRRLLGIAGRPRVTEDGRIIRRGLSPEVQERMASKCGVRTEMLLQKVRHLTGNTGRPEPAGSAPDGRDCSRCGPCAAEAGGLKDPGAVSERFQCGFGVGPSGPEEGRWCA
jgi:hypothetical protein